MNKILANFYRNLFYFTPFFLFGFQKSNLELSVVNTDNEAIPYALVFNINTKLVNYTDDNGTVNINYQDDSDELKISTVGFKTLIIKISEIKKVNNKIILEKNVVQLNELIVKPKKLTYKELGFAHSKHDFTWGTRAGLIFANYLKKPKEKDYVITNILIDLSKPLRQHSNSIIKLRLMKLGEKGYPGDDLLKKDVTIKVGKLKSFIDYKLKEEIIIPKEGIFVAVEIVGYEKIGELNTNPSGAQSIGISSTKIENREQYGSAWRFWTEQQQWVQMNYKSGFDTMYRIGLQCIEI
jgi:CarboxypepD_reg-like domain